MEMISPKIGKLLIFKERDRHRRLIKTVFFNYIPVSRFNSDHINECKLAAVELVERRLCNQSIAGKICGFHRNTVYKLLRTKKLLA
jgi:hypothetical protein